MGEKGVSQGRRGGELETRGELGAERAREPDRGAGIVHKSRQDESVKHPVYPHGNRGWALLSRYAEMNLLKFYGVR